MKRTIWILVLAIGMLVLLMPTVSATGTLPTADGFIYFNNESWSGHNTYVINKDLSPLVGSEYIGPVQIPLHWDKLDVVSVGIMVHGDLYPLKEKSGEYFLRVTDVGVTDYNRGTYYRINLPGVSGYDEYGVTFNVSNANSNFVPHHVYRAQAADTVSATKVFIVQAASSQEAIKKVEQGLGFNGGVPIEDVFEVGVDYTIDKTYEIERYSSTSILYGVVVTFHNYVYRVEVDYNGYMTYYTKESCLYVCPDSPAPSPHLLTGSSNTLETTFKGYHSLAPKVGPPHQFYSYSTTKYFDLSSGAVFFIGYKKVYGLTEGTIPIVFDQEVVS